MQLFNVNTNSAANFASPGLFRSACDRNNFAMPCDLCLTVSEKRTASQHGRDLGRPSTRTCFRNAACRPRRLVTVSPVEGREADVILDRFRLDDQVAVVTGAGRGLGAAMALAFAEAGADVVIASRTQSQLEEVAEQIKAVGRRAHIVTADLAHPEETAKLANTAIEAFGKLDIVVNNVGGTMPNTLMTTSTKDLRDAFSVQRPMEAASTLALPGLARLRRSRSRARRTRRRAARALRLPGVPAGPARGGRGRAGGPRRARRDAHRLGQVALLPAPGAHARRT